MSATLQTALAHQRKYLEPTAAELALPEDYWKLKDFELTCEAPRAAWRAYWADHGAVAKQAEERDRRRPKKAIAQRVRKRLGKAVE